MSLLLNNIWKYISGLMFALLVAISIAYYIQGNKLDTVNSKLEKSLVDNKLLEIQKDLLINTIGIQNDAMDKITISEKKNTDVYHERAIELSRSLEKEKLRVRDLNGSADCTEASRIIKRIIDANTSI